MMKRIVAVLCIVVMMFHGMMFPAQRQNSVIYAKESKEIGVGSETVFEGDNFEVLYRIDSMWDSAYNVFVSIKNTGGKSIENWALLFSGEDNITNIWNGKMVKNDFGVVMIKNAEWNQDIPAGKSVNLGFTAEYKEKISLPKSFALSTKRYKVEQKDYAVTFLKDSDWNTGYTARIEISNESDKAIEDWEMEFPLLYTIDTMWNGELTKTKDRYYVRNCGWNQNIKPSECITLGFSGIGKEHKDQILQSNIYAYTTEIDESLDSDGDNICNLDELKVGTNPYKEDTDGDGLSDFVEMMYLNLNPLERDTDENGILDGDEETDGDTLFDGTELKLGFSPMKKDTDGNGITDDKEMN